ncbi:MAG: LamG domain-containing protein [Candidatus Cloacimonetes bacterium]|nr:LamG domain-containing protein [Candidatus Cloacimonadota bacterium]
MGKVLIIGVLVIAVIFGILISNMNRHTRNLPDIITTDITYKEATNISNYAVQYAVQFTRKEFLTVPEIGDSLIINQRFDSFQVFDGYIDSIFYRYIPEKNLLQINTFVRATINDVSKEISSEAGVLIPPPYLYGSVASWRMDEESWDGVSYDVEDSSDGENDGIAEGGANTTEDPDFGLVGLFDGINDYVEVADDSTLHLLDSFSLCIWGNIDEDAESVTMLWKDSGWTDSNLKKYPSYGLWWREHGGGSPNTLVGGALTMEIDGDLSAEHYEEVTGHFVPDGDWHLFSLVFDGTYFYLYLDAVLLDTEKIRPNEYVYSSEYELFIGRASVHHNANGHPFRDRYYEGTMDDMGVWSEPLTQEQILEIFQYKMKPPLVYLRE